MRRRAPVASKMALPMAAGATVMAVSPAPSAGTPPAEATKTVLDGRNLVVEVKAPIGNPIHGRDSTVVPSDFFQQSSAHALQNAAFSLIPEPVGIRNRPAIHGDDEAGRADQAGFHGSPRPGQRARRIHSRLRNRHRQCRVL